MPQLGVLGCNLKCRVIIFMSFVVHLGFLPVEVHISSVEVNCSIIGILVNGLIEITLSLLKLIAVIVSQPPVIIVHRWWLNLYCFPVVVQSLLEILILKVRQSQVVLSRGFFGLQGRCFFKVLNWLFKLPETSVANTFIKLCLINIVLLGGSFRLKILQRTLIRLYSILYFIQAGLDEAQVIVIHAILTIIFDSEQVMLLSLIELPQLIVLHSCEIIILCQILFPVWFPALLVLNNANGHWEVKQCSLEVAHMVVALAPKEECLRLRCILITSRTEFGKRIL